MGFGDPALLRRERAFGIIAKPVTIKVTLKMAIEVPVHFALRSRSEPLIH